MDEVEDEGEAVAEFLLERDADRLTLDEAEADTDADDSKEVGSADAVSIAEDAEADPEGRFVLEAERLALSLTTSED